MGYEPTREVQLRRSHLRDANVPKDRTNITIGTKDPLRKWLQEESERRGVSATQIAKETLALGREYIDVLGPVRSKLDALVLVLETPRAQLVGEFVKKAVDGYAFPTAKKK
jgi:hypothetical protein